MKRRDFVKLLCATSGGAVMPGCGESPDDAGGRPIGKRVLVVAFDGMDPRIVESLMQAGRLPNFQRLAARGSFRRIATTMPPHTPVAFSSIISGADPGLHNVFDFIHRDPQPPGNAVVQPYFSTAKAEAPETDWALSLGAWRLPLSGGSTRLLRKGAAFWDFLIADGIDTDIYYLPANYPTDRPEGPGRFRSISGMGTPDLLGSYGEFTFFTPNVSRKGRRVGGGRFVYMSLLGNRGHAELTGPENFLRNPDDNGSVPSLTSRLEVVRDPTHRVAKVAVSGNVVLLNEGEWSNWIPIDFQTGFPGSTVLSATGAPTSVRGMVRMFVKQVHPKFELYVSPINIDPLAAINPISFPDTFAATLARRHGRFHTVGIPEDTKALSHGALNEEQFLAQAEASMQERAEHYRDALANFRQGCMFFYFGATDLVQHMFWRDRDPQHPGHDREQADRYDRVVEQIYVDTDRLVGQALKTLGPEDLLIVLSDHGFTSFRRGFNLNTWLLENGYLRLKNPHLQGKLDMFANVDWSGARAYGVGMNGLYINAMGREKHGTVKAATRNGLMSELRDKLSEVRDEDGSRVIREVHLIDELYPDADQQVAPDLIIGYEDGYRASWGTILGKMPRKLIEDNLDRWSGTHLISADLVPGMLLTSQPVAVEGARVTDIAPTILGAFGIDTPEQMSGQDLFQNKRNT